MPPSSDVATILRQRLADPRCCLWLCPPKTNPPIRASDEAIGIYIPWPRSKASLLLAVNLCVCLCASVLWAVTINPGMAPG